MTASVQRSPSAVKRFMLRKLHPTIGAEVMGLDLSKPLDPATFEGVQHAWYDHNILLFRDQNLSEDEQVAFIRNFGPLANNARSNTGSKSNGAVMFISNIRENGQLIGSLPDGEMWFHSDQCYIEKPCAGSALYAMEIPSKGGNTLFANTYAAYDTLPAATKSRLANLKAVNAYDYDGEATQKTASRQSIPDSVPHYAHPIVRTHPATKRKALYINRLMTAYVEGLPPEEGDALLNELYAHQEKPDFVYEHVWRPGDLLMWDNRCTLHARSDFDASERRMLRRVTVLGDKPF